VASARQLKVADPVAALESVPDLDGRRAGERVHTAVARLLERGVRQPAPVEVVTLARDIVVEPGLPVTYRQSAIQRLSTATASYFRMFALDETWAYVGSEVKAARCRYDLVFENEDGEVIADELKAGRVGDRVELKLADAQIARQLIAGRAKWGEAFTGIRAIFLAAPRASFLARPDGEREPLSWSDE
jgi:hypothetical protein